MHPTGKFAQPALGSPSRSARAPHSRQSAPGQARTSQRTKELSSQTKNVRTDARTDLSLQAASRLSSMQRGTAGFAASFGLAQLGSARSAGLLIPWRVGRQLRRPGGASTGAPAKNCLQTGTFVAVSKAVIRHRRIEGSNPSPSAHHALRALGSAVHAATRGVVTAALSP
jgi:hypothetical protein